MNRRILLLNAVFLLIVVRGGVTLHRNWVEYQSKHQPSLVKAGAATGSSGTVARSGGAVPGSQDWMDISSKNPFSFDRSDIVIAAKAEEKPIDTGPKPILFGTAFLGKEPMAMIGSGRAPSRSFRPMKVGETIDGWAITKIEEKTVLVQIGGKQETLIMNDPTVTIPRESIKTASSAPSAPPVAPIQSTSSPLLNAPASSPAASPSPAPNTPGKVIVTPFGNIIAQ
jgi:hypothetical protein